MSPRRANRSVRRARSRRGLHTPAVAWERPLARPHPGTPRIRRAISLVRRCPDGSRTLHRGCTALPVRCTMPRSRSRSDRCCTSERRRSSSGPLPRCRPAPGRRKGASPCHSARRHEAARRALALLIRRRLRTRPGLRRKSPGQRRSPLHRPPGRSGIQAEHTRSCRSSPPPRRAPRTHKCRCRQGRDGPRCIEPASHRRTPNLPSFPPGRRTRSGQLLLRHVDTCRCDANGTVACTVRVLGARHSASAIVAARQRLVGAGPGAVSLVR